MGFKFTWYGHAAVGLEIDGHSILVDPFMSSNPVCGTSPDDVNPGFILITHGHGDHIGDTISIAKRTGALVISNFEIASWLEKKGLKTHGQHLGGGYKHPFGYLKLTLALHGSMLPDGSYGGNPAGFLITTQAGEKIYLAGDTGLFGDMALIGEEELDLAVLPVGDNYTMGPADAFRAMRFLRPKRVVPIHYNTWDLIAQDVESWARKVESELGYKVDVMVPGETIEI